MNRIAQGKRAFQKQNHLLTTKSVGLDTRKNLGKKSERKRLEAFEMLCYRKMLKIGCME